MPLPPWLMIVIGALFVLGIVALVVKTLRPAGDLVGTIDLLSSTPAATFEAAAGDRVRFRLDVSAPHRSSVLTRRLESETLVLSIASPGLQPTSATCPVGGASASSSMGGGTTTMRGVVIDGELTVVAGGLQTVRAGHSLGREIHATMAMLHIYRRKSAA